MATIYEGEIPAIIVSLMKQKGMTDEYIKSVKFLAIADETLMQKTNLKYE